MIFGMFGVRVTFRVFVMFGWVMMVVVFVGVDVIDGCFRLIAEKVDVRWVA